MIPIQIAVIGAGAAGTLGTQDLGQLKSLRRTRSHGLIATLG